MYGYGLERCIDVEVEVLEEYLYAEVGFDTITPATSLKKKGSLDTSLLKVPSAAHSAGSSDV